MFYKRPTQRQELGQLAERTACEYLQKQGLKLLMRNFSCKLGELDLIMQDKGTLVFVEVRSRSNKDAYDPIASIHFGKQKRITRAATFFLQQKGWLNVYPCRFDVIGITYTQGKTDVNWIKHAFESI